MALLPLFLYKVIRPEVDGDARGAARRAPGARGELGPLTPRREDRRRHLRRHGGALGRGRRRSASTRPRSPSSAWATLLATGVLTLGDIAKEGDVLATFIWFAVLFTLSAQLERARLHGASWAAAWRVRLDGLAPLRRRDRSWSWSTSLLHYLFVSQTAHLLALFGVFLDVGGKLGVPLAPLALPAALRDQLLLRHHAAGVEREPALRGQRLPLAGASCTGSARSPPPSTSSSTWSSGSPWLMLVTR